MHVHCAMQPASSEKDGSETPQMLVNLPENQEKPEPADYTGKYEGTLPCSDCEAILVDLELVFDNTFSAAFDYVGKSKSENKTGFFTYQTHGSIITLIGVPVPNRFHAMENRLYAVDSEGENLVDASGQPYFLKKK